MTDAIGNETCQTCGRKIRSVGTKVKPRWFHLDVVEVHNAIPDLGAERQATPRFL